MWFYNNLIFFIFKDKNAYIKFPLTDFQKYFFLELTKKHLTVSHVQIIETKYKYFIHPEILDPSVIEIEILCSYSRYGNCNTKKL